MKKAILCVLLTLSMSVSAFALEVPTDTVVQNLNGSQQVIKTFTIPADQDPQSLIEQPFELEGYLYSFYGYCQNGKCRRGIQTPHQDHHRGNGQK